MVNSQLKKKTTKREIKQKQKLKQESEPKPKPKPKPKLKLTQRPEGRRFANRQRRSRGKSLPKEVKSDMNVPELHKIAKSLGIAYAGLNKAKLVKKINSYL